MLDAAGIRGEVVLGGRDQTLHRAALCAAAISPGNPVADLGRDVNV